MMDEKKDNSDHSISGLDSSDASDNELEKYILKPSDFSRSEADGPVNQQMLDDNPGLPSSRPCPTSCCCFQSTFSRGV